MQEQRLRQARTLSTQLLSASSWAALALFGVQFALLDVLLQGPALGRGPSWLGSALFWSGLALALDRRGRVALAVLAAWLAVAQLVFFRHYHGYLDVDGLACARRMWLDVAPTVMRLLPLTLAATGVVAALELALLRCSPRLGPGKPKLALALASLLGLGLGLGGEPTPDAAALGSLRALVAPSVAHAAGHVDVPPLSSRRARLPNVLVILTESVRALDYCSDPADPCPMPLETARLLPERIALRELRSPGSYTAITVHALLGGRVPLGSQQEVAATPLLFDYAHAVHAGSTRLSVAYWSGQSDSIFERSDVRSATDSFVTVDDLVGQRVDDLDDVIDRGVDALLAREVERRLPELDGPLLALVHLSGTHAPYYVDPTDAPFSPWVRTASWTSLAPLHNAYKNAIVAQDRSIARVVRAFVARAGSEPWLILFTSDHGEAFGEHKAIHHGQNTYDEQIHVPGFVAFGNGALDAAQVSALRAHQREPVTLLDVLPTLLDALGVLDAFPLAADRSRWQGRSWLRAPSGPRAPVPMTNCTPLFSCPLKNWGVLGDRHALVAQPWDDDFRCVDLRTGAEGLDLASPPCAELRRASRSWFDKLPNGRDNDRPR